ncbi:ArpD ABC-type protease/lipase transport system, ATPase and permease components [Rhabdaerophilaceae bacterium]
MLRLSQGKLEPYSVHFRGIFLCSVAANILVIAPSIHMLQVYDRVLSSRSMGTLVYLTAIVAFLLVIWGLADNLRGRIATRAAAKYAVSFAPKIFSHLAQGKGSATESGKVLRDFSSARSFIGGRAFIALFDLPFIPLYVGIMMLLHWSMALIAVIGIAMLSALSWLNMRATEASIEQSRAVENDAIGFAQAAFQRGEDLRAGGMLPAMLSIWSRKILHSLTEAESVSGKSGHYHAISKSFRQILQVLMMAWGAFLVLQNEMSAGMIFMASMLSGKAFGPIDQVTGGWEQISKGIASIRDIDALVGHDRSISSRMTLPQPEGAIAARNLSYVPNPDHPDRKVLNGVDLDLRAGEAIVITGTVGAGKSTLLRILAGAVPPSGGILTLGGVEYSQWPAQQWGQLIGYVPQEIEFFPGSIAMNIARFQPDAAQASILEAAQLAGAHDMIMGLPDGYRTVVGTGSFMLSSGQKQKIALARALYGSPRVLILDEPNANLDQVAESALLSAIAQARMKGTSVILAAHRSSVLRVVDRAFVLKGGALVPVGLQRNEKPAADEAGEADKKVAS